MEIIDKKTAAICGYKHYYTGKECVNGHMAKRFVSTGTCVECGNMASRRHTARRSGRQFVEMVTYKRHINSEFIPHLDALLSALELQYSIDTAEAIRLTRLNFMRVRPAVTDVPIQEITQPTPAPVAPSKYISPRARLLR